MGAFNLSGEPLYTKKYRLCALNVGNFAMGASGEAAGTDEMYNAFLEVFRKCNADIYLFSEWDINWNSSATSLQTLGFLKPYKTTYVKTPSSLYQGQMIYSDLPISDEYHQGFPGYDYYFLDGVVYMDGVAVHLISTHFTPWYQEDAEAQMQAVLDYINTNDIQNYIVGGDMNLGLHVRDERPQTQEMKFQIAREEVTLLESDGGVSIQGGHWGCKDRDGFLNTAGHGGWDAPNINMFDNFLISPTFRISNVFVATAANATDHDALCVDVELISPGE